MKIFFLIFNLTFVASLGFSAVPSTPPTRVSFAIATYNPFVIQEEDGHLKGIYQEYITAVIKKSGLEPQFETMPLNRVLAHASKGTYDFFMGVSGIPEAGEKYQEVARFHKLRVTLIGLVKNLDFNKDHLVIGKAPNSYCPLFTKEQEKNIRYFEYKDTDQALKMLVAKRISVLCTTRELFYFELQNSKYADLKFNEFNEFHHDFIISLFAHKRIAPEKIKSLNKAVAELEQKKLLSNLYKKYGLEEVARP